MFLTGISDFQAFNDVIADVISYDPFVVTPLLINNFSQVWTSVGVFKLRYQILKLLMTSSMTSFRMTVLQPPCSMNNFGPLDQFGCFVFSIIIIFLDSDF